MAVNEDVLSEQPPLQEEPKKIEQYDPTKRQSQDTIIDPYELIEKEAKKDTKLTNLKTENSASGSGNSGNSETSIYAKVKKVPKKEEIAYAVVDIKDSQDKYETVNGEILRRQTNDDSVEDDEDPYEKTNEKTSTNENFVESQENSGNSDLYASVKHADKKEDENELVETQENSGNSDLYASVNHTNKKMDETEVEIVEKGDGEIDAYAVVVKAEPALQSSIDPEEQEDSGASGFYAQVGTSVSSPSPPTPPPPPPPPHPANMNKSLEKNEISNYEPVESTNDSYDIERSNTYDSIKEVKMEHKLKREAADSKKHKSKHHSKKDDIQQQEKLSVSKSSPKSSRFSRVNPFKSSKKQKHRHSHESIEFPPEHTPQHQQDDFVDKVEKNNSLPSTARTRNKEIIIGGSAELSKKRHSSPHIPPPLPSVDKLLHLTEHKSRRGSSIDACSSPGNFELSKLNFRIF